VLTAQQLVHSNNNTATEQTTRTSKHLPAAHMLAIKYHVQHTYHPAHMDTTGHVGAGNYLYLTEAPNLRLMDTACRGVQLMPVSSVALC